MSRRGRTARLEIVAPPGREERGRRALAGPCRGSNECRVFGECPHEDEPAEPPARQPQQSKAAALARGNVACEPNQMEPDDQLPACSRMNSTMEDDTFVPVLAVSKSMLKWLLSLISRVRALFPLARRALQNNSDGILP